MRKLLRSIARHNMEAQKIEHKNKPALDKKGHKIGSKFSRIWREFVKIKFEVKKGTNTLYKKSKSKKAKAGKK